MNIFLQEKLVYFTKNIRHYEERTLYGHVKTSARKLKLGHEKVSQVENDHNDTEVNYTLA